MPTDEGTRDRIFAGGMVLLSLALMARSYTYPASSSVFPRFLSVVLLALSALLVVDLLRKPRPQGGSRPGPRLSLGGVARHPGLFVFGSLTLYVLAMTWLGFMLSTIGFMVGTMLHLGSRSWVAVLAWGVGFPILAYLLFHTLLGLQLPRGFWQ